MPRGVPHVMAEYLSSGYDRGVRGYYGEAYPDDLWSEGPKLYVLARLLWSPHADVDALLDGWYARAVGPAAAPLRAYFEFWEDFWRERVPTTYGFQHDNWGIEYLDLFKVGYLDALTLADLDTLDAHMAAVAALAAT